MKILFIGDIVGRSGREAVLAELENLKYKEDIDFCIANGENASGGLGMSRRAYEELKSAGIDYFTMGNHTFSKPDAGHLLSEGENICRPANYTDFCPGEGYAIVTDSKGRKIAVMNLMGTVYNDIALTNPFLAADELIEKIKNVTNIIILDFHAEATSEKIAMGQYLDSRVSAVVGTHTHVQTADAMILPRQNRVYNRCRYDRAPSKRARNEKRDRDKAVSDRRKGALRAVTKQGSHPRRYH